MNSNWRYSTEMPNLGQNWLCFVLCDLEIWRMTLKSNRSHFLCHIKPCASFRHHMWIQTRVTVRKQLNWVLTSCDLDLWPLTLIFCMDITLVNSNQSWKFHDNTMRGTLSKRCDRQTTDGRTDRQTDGLNHSYSCLVAAKKSSQAFVFRHHPN